MTDDRPKVLVADDEPQAREFLKTRLDATGYDCSIAQNGLEALSLARKEKPRVIILDFMMPEMDGFETLKALRRDPETKNIHVIFFTAKDASVMKYEDIDAIDKLDFIFKPFDDRALTLLLNCALNPPPLVGGWHPQ